MTAQEARQRADRMYAMGQELALKAPQGMQLLGPSNLAMSSLRSEATTTDQYRYAKRGWPYAAISPIANRVSREMLRVARPASKQKKMDPLLKMWLPQWVKNPQWASLESLATHPLLDAVNRPNPYMTQQMLMWGLAFSLKATGRCYWWFNQQRDGLQIWYTPAHWIEPDPNSRLRERWLIKPEGYSGEPIPVDGDEIACFAWPDCLNPLASLSAVSAASLTILSDEAIHEAQYTGFQVGQMPNYAFIVGERQDSDGVKRRPQLTKDQREELDQRFRQFFGGPRRHGRPIILDALIEDVKRLSVAPSEMDYMQSMKAVERELEKMIGTNPIMMGEIENANRASATVAEDIFLANQVNPILTMVGQVLTMFVAKSRLFNEKVVAYYQELVARDPELEQKDWHKALDLGAASFDDFRIHRLGLPPLPNGNGRVSRVNMALMTVNVDDQTVEIPVYENTREFKTRITALWDKQYSRNRTQFEAALDAYFRKQAVHIAEQVESGVLQAGLILPVQEWTDSLKATCAQPLKTAMYSGAGIEETVQKSRKADFDVFAIDGKVTHWIDNYLVDLLRQPYWDDITRGIADELDGMLAEYIRVGMTSREMADALREKFGDLSHGRAMRIANTELQGAMNSGSYAMQQALTDTGLVTGSEWNTIIDDATRGMQPGDKFNHVRMNGQRAKSGEMFDVDGEQAPFPGHYSLSAGNRVHCRCFVTATTIAD
mgnify:CR=1 FL=1